MAKYICKCECGRVIEIFAEGGKIKHKIKGTGNDLLDSLGGEGEQEEENEKEPEK